MATWIGFAFSVALSAIVLITFHTSHTWETAFPAFFSFLPMAFLFTANADRREREQSTKQIRELKARVEQLEAGKGAA